MSTRKKGNDEKPTAGHRRAGRPVSPRKRAEDPEVLPPVGFSRLEMEQQMADLGKLMAEQKLEKMPVTQYIAAVSVGIVDGQLVGDLDYARDSRAEVDMNVVGDETGNLIEVQGTAENGRFSRKQLNDMLDLAQSEIAGLIRLQKQALES